MSYITQKQGQCEFRCLYQGLFQDFAQEGANAQWHIQEGANTNPREGNSI